MFESVGSEMDTTKVSSNNDEDVVDFLWFGYYIDKIETKFCMRTTSANWFAKKTGNLRTRIWRRCANLPPAAVSPSSSLSIEEPVLSNFCNKFSWMTHLDGGQCQVGTARR